MPARATKVVRGAKAKAVKARGAGPERVNPQLYGMLRPIASLKHDPENARLHPETNLAAIRASLRRFGQQKPVVALPDGTVVAGNGMLAAAREEGWRRLAVVVLPGSNRNEARAYALADNRTAELARWDHEGLGRILRDLKAVDADVASLGWDEHELEMLLRAEWAQPEATPGGLDHQPEAHTVRMTHEQYEVVMRACVKVRTDERDENMSEGRCIELVCADFLS